MSNLNEPPVRLMTSPRLIILLVIGVPACLVALIAFVYLLSNRWTSHSATNFSASASATQSSDRPNINVSTAVGSCHDFGPLQVSSNQLSDGTLNLTVGKYKSRSHQKGFWDDFTHASCPDSPDATSIPIPTDWRPNSSHTILIRTTHGHDSQTLRMTLSEYYFALETVSNSTSSAGSSTDADLSAGYYDLPDDVGLLECPAYAQDTKRTMTPAAAAAYVHMQTADTKYPKLISTGKTSQSFVEGPRVGPGPFDRSMEIPVLLTGKPAVDHYSLDDPMTRCDLDDRKSPYLTSIEPPASG